MSKIDTSSPFQEGIAAAPELVPNRNASLNRAKMDRTGLEPLQIPAGKLGVTNLGGIKSGNTSAPIDRAASLAVPADPNLAAVLEAWPRLPAAIKAGIVAMVAAAAR